MNYFDVTLTNGNTLTVAGPDIESALYNNNISMEEVDTFEDSSEIAFEKSR